jgi:hypothetical protein
VSRFLADRLSGWGLLGAVALLTLLIWPASASADSFESILTFGPRAPAEFTARGSNGYVIRVEGSAGKVKLSASGPSGTATYAVPGNATRRGIAANFGRRGRVDVEFRPSRRMRIETPPNRCEGKLRVTHWGVFVGTIRFAGERGFTRLRAGRMAGRTHTFPRWKCKRRRGAGAGRLSKSSAGADRAPVVWEVSNRRLGLEVSALSAVLSDKQTLTFFFAALRERRKRMQITRTLVAPAEEGEFTYDESLTEATVAPSKPFSGTATFERRPGGSVSWTGSLSIVLPGTARIPLVGARYHPRLYRLGKDGIAKPGV